MRTDELCMTLYASCLASKFGFDDGNSPDEYYPDQNGGLDWRTVLSSLVMSKLMPLLPGVSVYTFPTCHNPIRAHEDSFEACRNSDVEVDVTWDDVREEVAKIMAHKK